MQINPSMSNHLQKDQNIKIFNAIKQLYYQEKHKSQFITLMYLHKVQNEASLT